jgi:hypothetical protein
VTFRLQKITVAEDGERCGSIVERIGSAVLAAVDFLIEKGQFKQGSEIRNLGLVLALYLSFAQKQHGLFDEEVEWRFALVKRAETHGVTLTGPFDARAVLDKVAEDEPVEDMAKFKNIKWKNEVRVAYEYRRIPTCKHSC